MNKSPIGAKEYIMANNVTAQVLGGQSKTTTAGTVQELVSEMGLGENHTVKVNGQDATYETVLNDYDFISFGDKVKGGL